MSLSAFPYVGGKTILSDWIIDQLPAHNVYVEPFGGSAAVLLNKPRSNIEVYNDLDGDVVQFFEVARERPDELAEWCRRTPYSEELHGRWVSEFYAGHRPEDPIKRAGRFLFLRYTQFAGKYNSPSGFKRDTPRTFAGDSQVWRQAPERINKVCDRFQGVSVQNRDFAEVIDHYDAPDVVFYCDPPYLNKEDTYLVDGFDHAELADALEGIEGYALVSYADQPAGFYEDWGQITRGHYHDSGARLNEDLEEVTERLITNYDPSEVEPFLGPQAGLEEFVVEADGGPDQP